MKEQIEAIRLCIEAGRQPLDCGVTDGGLRRLDELELFLTETLAAKNLLELKLSNAVELNQVLKEGLNNVRMTLGKYEGQK